MRRPKAVEQLTKAPANERAAKGVNVNAIAPGYMNTDNTAALPADPERFRQIMGRIPARRSGPQMAWPAQSCFLHRRANDYIHGHVLTVNGGWLSRGCGARLIATIFS
jgi:2-deoxy-D-gluconate 3-dehydrogenase